jgi:hypothetical protein
MRATLIAAILCAALAASGGVPAGDLLFDEQFEGDDGSWAVGTFGDGQRSFEFGSGTSKSSARRSGYFVTARNNTGARAWCSSCGNFADGVFEAELSIVSGEPGAFGGIVLRSDPDNTSSYYLFEVYSDGAFSFWFHDGDSDSWVALADKTFHPAVKKGSRSNRLTVVARGESFELYVNGEHVDTAFDYSLSAGYVGVYAEGGSGDETTVRFTALRVYSIEGALRPGGPKRGALVVRETFDDNGNDWSEGASGDRTYGLRDGSYKLTADDTAGQNWCSELGTFGDAVFEGDFRFPKRSSDAAVGLVFRMDTEETQYFYMFQMNDRGESSMWFHAPSGWTNLVAVGRRGSPDLTGGFTLTVVAEGNHFTLYVDGGYAAEVDDYYLFDGYVGVHYQSDEGVRTVYCDELRVYDLSFRLGI